jgi:hypothetical protein
MTKTPCEWIGDAGTIPVDAGVLHHFPLEFSRTLGIQGEVFPLWSAKKRLRGNLDCGAGHGYIGKIVSVEFHDLKELSTIIF